MQHSFPPISSISNKMLPPQNVEAEQAVLGAILLQDKALLKIVELLVPEDFYRDAHKTIFAAMLILFEKREPHDQSHPWRPGRVEPRGLNHLQVRIEE